MVVPFSLVSSNDALAHHPRHSEREYRANTRNPGRYPFYARSLVSSRLLGEPITAMHESLSLERFATTWIKLLLLFRMLRRG